MVATSTIEPRLPSIGMAFISTPLAPSLARSAAAAGAPAGRWASRARRAARHAAWWLADVGGLAEAHVRGRARHACLLPPEPAVRLNHKRVPRRRLSCVNTTSAHLGRRSWRDGARLPADTLALTVHGPAGAVDLLVPDRVPRPPTSPRSTPPSAGSRSCRRCTRAAAAPPPRRRPGRRRADQPARSWSRPGRLRAAALPRRTGTAPRTRWWHPAEPGPFSVIWCALAVVVAAARRLVRRPHRRPASTT